LKKRKRTAESKLLKTFKNRFVTISIKDVKIRSARGSLSNTAFVGYLVDEDKENLYLSQEEDGKIYAAIPKEQNAGITATDEIAFLMENIDVPDDQGIQ